MPELKPRELERSIERYRMSDPAAMSKMSEAAIFYAFQDYKKDLLNLADQLAVAQQILRDHNIT